MYLDIFGLNYEVKDVSNTNPNMISSCAYQIENIWGIDGLEALKRANCYGDPCGYIGNVLLTVEAATITFEFINEIHFNDRIEEVVRCIVEAYSSVGWEMLGQD